MQKEKKYLKCILNADDADFSVAQDEVINSENVRFGSTDAGVINTIESVGSTTLLSSIQPSVTFANLGSVLDDQGQRVIYFVKDLYGPWDSIICYDIRTGAFYNLLKETNVIGGLGFDKNYLIQARVINGLLYWTDNLNQPRRINIDAAINMQNPGTIPGVIPYINQLSAEVITVIRKPPVYPMAFTKESDPALDANLIKNFAFRFSYFYIYRDGERSTIAPHSLIANYNYTSDTSDTIDLVIPFSEKPDQDVEIIQLIVIYADTNTAFFLRSWNKANPTDAIEIAQHVAGIAALSYNFINSSVGEAVDSAALAKPFDTVPLLSETLEQGTNRLFLGRNLLGYNTPITTSLTGSIINSDDNVIFVGYNEYPYTYTSPGCLTYYWYILYSPTPLDGTHPAGYYDYAPIPLYPYADACSIPFPSFPTQPIAISDLTYIGANVSDVRTYIPLHDEARLGFTITGRSFAPGGASFYFAVISTSSASSNISILKSDSSYQLGIVFYDQYLRQCGVVEGPRLTTPDRAYADSTSLQYGIQWDLSPGPLPNEIPDWARFYSIVVTKNLRTNFFVQARTSQMVYATKDADGNYLFTQVIYADDYAGVAVKLDLLSGLGMGYSYNAGDIIKIYTAGGPVFLKSLSVIDQVGNYVIAELYDFGDVSSAQVLFEIYTPTPQTAGQFYYEIAQFYPINDATTTARSYSVITGTIPGDVYLLQRGTAPNDYLTENMSPNSTFWRNWFTNAGRVQIKDSIGQRFKQTSVKWSNTFIPGTITNGLSSFDALDEKILPGELGPLRRLVITSKVNNELGAVMLGICEQETASMYLGEQQLVGSAANAFIAQASGVIGTVNILKGSFGTINPESVTEFRGNVYWVDLLNGKVIQYSSSGLFPISSYKTTRFWKLFSDQFLSMTTEQIEDMGNRPFIFTGVDPHHMELLISIPRLLSTPPKGSLPDYPFIGYPFDIYDGQAKTVVYKLNQEPNRWQGAFKFCSEGFQAAQNKLFSFKHGQLYLHNSLTSQCNFYGTQERAKIMLLSNLLPKVPKSYNNMSIQANMKPVFVYMYADTPHQQSSDLISDDFKNLEGILYSRIYRNKLIPTSNGYNITGLLTGEKMRTKALKILLEFDVSQQQLEFEFIDIGFTISQGHDTFNK